MKETALKFLRIRKIKERTGEPIDINAMDIVSEQKYVRPFSNKIKFTDLIKTDNENSAI